MVICADVPFKCVLIFTISKILLLHNEVFVQGLSREVNGFSKAKVKDFISS